jgi:hypothetical protein
MRKLMRKLWLFVITLLLMHAVALAWKVTPMPQKCLTMFYNNRWAITLVISALCGIAGTLIAMEDD